ncbi:trigger factor [Arenicella xantha]|uniref:Trigger factor n=1 Tax=Arenicella xantha TaxID=644221 RepID=A0A395JNN3_9GAMM|nr:trigger factor [Arenicella xantha]RBP51407.1 trigger factor [Arenicella xantha]
MQASVEKTSTIGRKLSVVVPADKIETAVQARLKQLSKRVKIQGFRPGKVPMKIVEQQYRGSATNDVLGDLIQSSLQEALSGQDEVPAVQPDITPDAPVEKGKDFTYTASFDVYPEFEKLDLEGIKVVKPESEVVDADIDRVVDNMRKQQLTWKELKRKSKKGDRVIVDFVGKIDGEEFDGGKASDYPVVLGEGQMLADFEAGIKGMKAGESKDIDVVFPDDYNEELGGKTAVFTIDAKTVSEPVLPEVDEEFVKSFGIESGDVDELRAEVRSNLETNLESQLSSQLRQRAFDALVEQNKTDVPVKMVREEAGRMIKEQKNQMIQQGIDAKMLENFPDPEFEVLRPQAEKRVALGLLMMEIIRKQELKPDEEKVNARIEKMASSYEQPEEFVQYYKSNQEALAQVQSIVLEEQVVDFLIKNADVEVEKIEASTLLNMQG